MNNRNILPVIGRAELVELPTLKLSGVPAKTDTGADTSAIWASQINKIGDKLHVVFFGDKSEFYTGEVVKFEKRQFTQTRVENSFGHFETRYKIKLPIIIKGRRIIATFTLADRQAKNYPILLGRRLLAGKFLVDVKLGQPHINDKLKKSNIISHSLTSKNQEGITK